MSAVWRVVPAALLSAVWLSAAACPVPCGAAEPIRIDVPARTTPVDFATEIVPLLHANCVACHNQKKAEGNLNLETRQAILKGGDQGPAVVAGKSDESLLLAIAAHRETTIMPPPDNIVGARPLTPGQLGLLKLWIDQGAIGGESSTRAIRWQTPAPQYQPVLATAVTPDGQFAVCSRGRRLCVYHLPSGKVVGILADPALNSASTQVEPASADAHQDIVRSLAFDASGELLASGGFREVKLWRRPRVTRSAEWAHEAPIRSLAVRADGQQVATGDERGQIQVRDAATGNVLRAIVAHEAAVTGLAYAGAGGTLFSCSVDKSLRSWDAAGAPAGKPVVLSSPVHSLAAIDQGRLLITGEQRGMVLAWEADAVARMEGEPPKPRTEIQAHNGEVSALAAVAGSPHEVVSSGADRLVRRWDVPTGKQLAQFQTETPLVALAVTTSGQRIAAAGAGQVTLWDETGKLVARIGADPRLAAKVTQLESAITFTKGVISRSEQDLNSYEGLIRIAMVTVDEVKKAEEAVVTAQKARDEKKAALDKAKAANDKVEAAEKMAADAETAVMVAETVVQRSKGVAERTALKLAAARQALAEQQELLKQQDTARAAAEAVAKATTAHITALTFSHDQRHLAMGCDDGAVHIFDTDSGMLSQSLAEHRGAVRVLCGSAQERIVSGAADGRTLVWNAPTQWRLERIIGGPDHPEVLVDRVLSLDFSRDGRWLATGGGLPSRSGEVKILQVDNGALVREFPGAHAETVFAVRFSPTGGQLATASGDRLIKVFDISSGTELRHFAGHTGHVLGLSWKADGKSLVSCGADNMLKQWDFETGLPVRSMKGGYFGNRTYKAAVTGVTFIGDSEEILAISGDGTVRLHRACSEHEIMTFTGSQGYQCSAAVTPDGKVVLAGGGDGALRVWSGHQPQLRQTLPP